jgi:hypothetical protein
MTEPNYDPLFLNNTNGNLDNDPVKELSQEEFNKLDVHYKIPDKNHSTKDDPDPFIVEGESLIGNCIYFNKIGGFERLINSENFDDNKLKDNLLLKLFTPNVNDDKVNALKIRIFLLLLLKIKEENFVKWLNEYNKQVLKIATHDTYGYNWTKEGIILTEILDPSKVVERQKLRTELEEMKNTCPEASCAMDHKPNLWDFLCCFKPKAGKYSGGKKKSKKYIKNKQKTKHRRRKNKLKTYRKQRSL